MRTLLVPVFVLGLLTGCTAAADPTPTATVASATRSASATPTPTPSPSPSPTAVESFPAAPATETAEQAEIRAAWMEYWRVYDKFTSDMTLTDLSETQYITAGEQMNTILDVVADLRESKLRSLGGLQFRDIEVGLPTEGSDGTRTAVVNYCVDRTGLWLENYGTGERMPAPGAPTFREQTTLEEGLDGLWRVAQIRNQEATC